MVVVPELDQKFAQKALPLTGRRYLPSHYMGSRPRVLGHVLLSDVSTGRPAQIK